MKASHRQAARKTKIESAWRARRIKIIKAVAWIGGLISFVATVIAAIQPAIDLSLKPATALIALPRPVNSRMVPERLIILNSKIEQRVFYMVDRENAPTRFIVGLPYSISNIGDKRLQKVTISFAFTHVSAGLKFDAPNFEEKGLNAFFPDIKMNAAIPSGRQELKRSAVVTPTRATISYNFDELLPNQESQFEFHFSPNLYDVSLPEGVIRVPMSAYDVNVSVTSDTLVESNKFRLFILPADDKDEFSTGIDLFSYYLSCKTLCNSNILKKIVHSNTWLAKKFAQEYENVAISPLVRLATVGGELTTVLTPSDDIRVARFVQILGGD